MRVAGGWRRNYDDFINQFETDDCTHPPMRPILLEYAWMRIRTYESMKYHPINVLRMSQFQSLKWIQANGSRRAGEGRNDFRFRWLCKQKCFTYVRQSFFFLLFIKVRLQNRIPRIRRRSTLCCRNQFHWIRHFCWAHAGGRVLNECHSSHICICQLLNEPPGRRTDMSWHLSNIKKRPLRSFWEEDVPWR